MLYLFALGIPMSIVSALITLSDSPLYQWYVDAPRVWDSITALDDQQLGGLIMWVPGMMVFWVAITIIFFRWSTREQREEWRERELIRARG
jgi:cytochrome c oxidase assembly factor CtaG